MNGISALWKAVVNELNANAVVLGIGGAERAATGSITTLTPPCAVVWIDPQTPLAMSQHGAVRLPLDVYIYCIAAPTVREDDAVDGAIEIAKKIFAHLNNTELADVILYQPDNQSPIEIVERSSTGAVVSVILKAEVIL